MKPRPRIVILADLTNGWGRRLISGILNFVEKHDAWDIDLLPEAGPGEPKLPRGWSGDGIIARVRTPAIAQWINRLGLPAVNVSGIEIDGCNIPRVTTNLQATAKLAAEHFVSRGYSRFAYVGPLQHAYVARHAEAFIEQTRLRNSSLPAFDTTDLHESIANGKRLSSLNAWLQELPRPSGLFSWSISDAMTVLRSCRQNNIAVPDEIAVLAGDDDALICRVSQPTLSGLVVASEQIGFQAAARLQGMISGQPDNGLIIALDPIEIRTRNSTDALAITDEQIRRAMHFMRQHAQRQISIDEIAESVPMNRRALERKFRAQFGTSPLEEMMRLRLSKVRQLLSLTDLTISQIADRCGFTTPTYMTALFRSRVGTTPLRYRAQSRAR